MTKTDESKDVVFLISCDKQVFELEEKYIHSSKLLQVLFDRNYPFCESLERTVALPIKSEKLRRAIDFMKYAYEFREDQNKFFEFDVKPIEACDLMDISSYLQL